MNIFFFFLEFYVLWSQSQSQSQSYVMTDGKLVSLSWCQAPFGTQDQIFVAVRQLKVCWCGAHSLMRGWVCRLQLRVLNQLKWKLHHDQRSVSQSVLVSSPIWYPRPDFCFCQTVAVLSMWGTLSDERMGLSIVKSLVPCGYLLFTALHVTVEYMCVPHIQGLCKLDLA
jgi:hypothetical protein